MCIIENNFAKAFISCISFAVPISTFDTRVQLTSEVNLTSFLTLYVKSYVHACSNARTRSQ